jgi:hypothetical protein
MQRFRTEEQFSVLWSQYQLAGQFPTLLFEYSSADYLSVEADCSLSAALRYSD